MGLSSLVLDDSLFEGIGLQVGLRKNVFGKGVFKNGRESIHELIVNN